MARGGANTGYEGGLENLIIRLQRMTVEELLAADPNHAARWYKVNPNHAAGYIQMEQKQRGLPPLEWQAVDYEGKPTITDAMMIRSVSNWEPGDECAHGIEYPGPCEHCEAAVRRARGPVPNFRKGAAKPRYAK